MSKVNLPPLQVPKKILADSELKGYFEEQAFVIYQLYQRTGGGDDIESGTNNIVVTTAISNTDSPYTVTDKYARIYVDASSGNVTVAPYAPATDTYLDVIKTDSSANYVRVQGSVDINGETYQDLLYQYESIEIGSNGLEYFVL